MATKSNIVSEPNNNNIRGKRKQNGPYTMFRNSISNQPRRGNLTGLRVTIAFIGIILAFIIYWYPEQQILEMVDTMRSHLTGKSFYVSIYLFH